MYQYEYRRAAHVSRSSSRSDTVGTRPAFCVVDAPVGPFFCFSTFLSEAPKRVCL